jgi:hypothetical protein
MSLSRSDSFTPHTAMAFANTLFDPFAQDRLPAFPSLNSIDRTFFFKVDVSRAKKEEMGSTITQRSSCQACRPRWRMLLGTSHVKAPLFSTHQSLVISHQ